MNPGGKDNNLVTFTLILRDDERQEIMRSFSRLLEALRKSVPIVESTTPAAVKATPAQLPTVQPSPAPAPRSSPPSVPAPADRWAIDPNGQEFPWREKSEEIDAYTVMLWQCQNGTGKNGPYVAVRWEQRRAYCHAPNLFSWLVAAHKEKRKIVLYLTDADGNYAHIVGIRA
jgi:hypothetical protein